MVRLPAMLLLAALLLACLPAPQAQAETRAWLERDRIRAGETATLNVETDQPGAPAPDWSPLDTDFEVSGHTSTRRVEVVGGETRASALFAVALRPRREGVMKVPSVAVGRERTAPLTLTVMPGLDPPEGAGADAFIETVIDTRQAWVQQSVGFVLRLHYATPLVSGELDQPQPEGAALQRIGEDVQYTREIDGRRYKVVERRFVLVPERSGTLEIPAARFRGSRTGNVFDQMFGNAPHTLRASGQVQRLEVRAMPDGAPRPWLPLQALQGRFLEAPQAARAGEAVEVVVELRASGATAAQMPEPELRVGDGAQVFAEPAQTQEHFEQGRPQVVLTRRFSIVPHRPGTLPVQAAPLQWWDAVAGGTRTVELPPLSIDVRASTADTAALPPARVDEDGRWMRVPGIQGEVRPWPLATVAFALLWLATLAWALQRRQPAGAPRAAAPGRVLDALDAERARLRILRLRLDTGDLGEVAKALCALAQPPAADLDALRARLGDPAQVAAVDALQRARWAGGDAVAARARLREAFADGPRWSTGGQANPAPDPVPPLYPG